MVQRWTTTTGAGAAGVDAGSAAPASLCTYVSRSVDMMNVLAYRDDALSILQFADGELQESERPGLSTPTSPTRSTPCSSCPTATRLWGPTA